MASIQGIHYFLYLINYTNIKTCFEWKLCTIMIPTLSAILLSFFPLKIHEFAFSFCTIRVIFNMYETNLISLNKVWRRTITPNITQIPEAPLEINYKKKFNIVHSVHCEWT